jgi:hypothetical protein
MISGKFVLYKGSHGQHGVGKGKSVTVSLQAMAF